MAALGPTPPPHPAPRPSPPVRLGGSPATPCPLSEEGKAAVLLQQPGGGVPGHGPAQGRGRRGAAGRRPAGGGGGGMAGPPPVGEAGPRLGRAQGGPSYRGEGVCGVCIARPPRRSAAVAPPEDLRVERRRDAVGRGAQRVERRGVRQAHAGGRAKRVARHDGDLSRARERVGEGQQAGATVGIRVPCTCAAR
jgi:hypothetical protein